MFYFLVHVASYSGVGMINTKGRKKGRKEEIQRLKYLEQYSREWWLGEIR